MKFQIEGFFMIGKVREQIIYMDFLRVFAAFAVIVLHAAAPLLKKMAEGEMIQFMHGNIIDSATRWCVPIFFMISGALLLNSKREFDLTFFLKKRFDKILIPFLVFSVIYFYINNKGFDITQFILKFANNAIAGHLWFFYAMIAVYLFSPVLILFVKHSSQRINLFVLLVWFFFCSLFPFLNGLIPLLKINFFGPFGIYLGYFLLGYVLFTKDFSRVERLLIYVLGVLSYFITFYGTYYYTHEQGGTFFPIFYTYNSPNVLLMSIAIFVFFKYNCNFKMKNTKVLTKISSLTFGVYLIHPYFLGISMRNTHFNFLYNDHLLITIPLIGMTVFIICLILSYIISIIPIIKKVI
jgi:surface polysaccharide O-acyltransferase-like enzyme